MGILFVSGTFLYYRLQHKLISKADQLILDEEEELMLSIMDSNTTLNDLKTTIELEFSQDRYYQLSARLVDGERNTVIASENFSVQIPEISESTILNAKEGNGVLETIRIQEKDYPFRLLTRKIFQDGSLKYILQIGLNMKPMYKTTENLKNNLLMLIPMLIILSIAGGWYLSRKSLSPIENITETSREITASNLNRRLAIAHTGDEVDELAKTINLMLNRLEGSFRRSIQFTSDASHELRTPIAALKTGTEVILSKERTAEEYRKLHENNLISLEKMTRMINDLLLLSRSDSVENILHVKKFNLSNLLKELQNKFSVISDPKKVELSINGIPDIQINGDDVLLRRVFSNLLDNAIKYTSPNGRVCISLDDSEDEIIARIEDSGIGISEDNLEKIFDRFYRVDPSRSREAGGTGLGLNISKNIVELHKGRIEVKSKIGAGSKFDVILPKNS
jgi:heavy metal sensor kinase